MALSDKDYTELQGILQALEPNLDKVYPVGRGFIADQIERERQYGQDMFMSPKQWAWLRKLNDEFGAKPPMQGRTAEKMTDEELDGDDIAARNRDLDDEIPF